MKTEALKLALEAAYLEGFNASGEGYNGEYPFQDNDVRPEKDHGWVRGRDNRINAIKEALAQPEQEPVEDLQAKLKWATEQLEANINWEFVAAAKEEMLKAAWAEIKELREQIKESEQEPLEYWNAVEGWVKIDEVREHFDSVGCGTIYKTSGEGRVPLSLCKAQSPQRKPLSGYINGAGIKANDSPHIVVEKIERAIKAAHGIKE